MICDKCKKPLTSEHTGYPLGSNERWHHTACPEEGDWPAAPSPEERGLTQDEWNWLVELPMEPDTYMNIKRCPCGHHSPGYSSCEDPILIPWTIRHFPHRDINKDEVVVENVQIHGQKDSPLLSVLFCLVGNAVFAKRESESFHESLQMEPKGWLHALFVSGYNWSMSNNFDQIRSDVQQWVESLEGDKPLPRLERKDGDLCIVFSGAGTGREMTEYISETHYRHVCTIADREILVYSPTKYTASWTQIYPRKYLPYELIEDGVEWAGYSEREEMCRLINGLQTQDFSVFRLTVTREV